MSTIKVVSPANIAFIKYWGQRDASKVLPFNDNFSMNLSSCQTTIELEVLENPKVQEMQIKLFEVSEYRDATPAQLKKVTDFYHITKKFLKKDTDFGFKIRSANSFPMKAGIASSASFFSALALAFATAFKAEISQKELSILARLSGSGSAARSVPDGFSWWNAGTDSDTSYAESLAAAEYWDLIDLVLVVSTEEKQTGSQDGHQGAETSPFFIERQEYLKSVTPQIKEAFMQKDFTKFGTLIEAEAYNFCHILNTQVPPLKYWTQATDLCDKEIEQLRKKGTECYFTIDAGANLHLICEQKNAEKLKQHFATIPGVKHIISNQPCEGTHLI